MPAAKDATHTLQAYHADACKSASPAATSHPEVMIWRPLTEDFPTKNTSRLTNFRRLI